MVYRPGKVVSLLVMAISEWLVGTIINGQPHYSWLRKVPTLHGIKMCVSTLCSYSWPCTTWLNPASRTAWLSEARQGTCGSPWEPEGSADLQVLSGSIVRLPQCCSLLKKMHHPLSWTSESISILLELNIRRFTWPVTARMLYTVQIQGGLNSLQNCTPTFRIFPLYLMILALCRRAYRNELWCTAQLSPQPAGSFKGSGLPQ